MAAWGDGDIVSLLLGGLGLERASRKDDESGEVEGGKRCGGEKRGWRIGQQWN